ncbi:MAG TPA: TonB-dependent receptor, partial [Fibrobacteraceae bacterium]|nr:TonB-dependent receptor [Fibrobacteraceae bacterium]
LDDHTMTVGYELEYDRVQFWQYILENKIMDKQKPFHHVGYLMDAWQLNPDLLVQYGVRLNYQTLSKHFGIEPRLSLAYQIDEDKSVEFYAGRYLQYMNSVMFSDQESLNEFYYPSVTTTKGKHLKPASSYLFAAGYKQRNLWDRFDGSIEAYFKTQNGLNTFKIAQDSTSEDSTSNDFLLADYFGTAEGYSMGYELSLRKENGPWFGGISWSHSLSVLRSKDSIVYHPNWHQPYAVKLDLGINWKGDEDGIWKYKKKGQFFRSSLVLKYASGMPLTEKIGYYQPYEMDQGDYQDDIVVVSGSRNAGRQTNYFRIDLKLIDIGVENRWNFSWTIINLTNHENMFYYYYDTNKNPPQFEAIYQFPFLPVMLNYEYYF